jgi:flagellin
MPISLMSNPTSLAAQRNLTNTQNKVAGNINRLSSGLRINSAADDAAGLGISEKLKSEIKSISQASRNANDGISMTQVAEGALNEVAGVLTRMREISVQSANGTLGGTERGFLDTEFQALKTEIDRISNVTEFNGIHLLNGSAAGGLAMQVGIRNSANDQITVTIASTAAADLGLGTVTISTLANAQGALTTLDNAISAVSSRRSSLGAVQSRLQVTMSNLSVSHENLSSANSRIRDVDVAEESASLARNQILSQAGAAMLAQANQLPSVALSLLRG